MNALSEFQVYHKSHLHKAIRAKYIILLFFHTGIHISEAVNNTMSSFIKRKDNWFLCIVQSHKLQQIPISITLLEALVDFRLNIGMSPRPQSRDQIPLIPMKNLKRSINPKRINQIIKWAFNLGALHFEPHDLKTAFKLRQVTVHWLIHSYIKHDLEHQRLLKS